MKVMRQKASTNRQIRISLMNNFHLISCVLQRLMWYIQINDDIPSTSFSSENQIQQHFNLLFEALWLSVRLANKTRNKLHDYVVYISLFPFRCEC